MSGDLHLFNFSHAIRKIDLSRDLFQVADLIELCFPIHEDPDGQTYIREMRKIARDMQYLGWFNWVSAMGATKATGFVWEEDGRIIGNLHLIPFRYRGKTIYLIANVAVHPDHRRRGIGRALTQHALGALRRYGEKETWLQVRDDNSSAINLYHSLGFENRAVRSTWRIYPRDFIFKYPSNGITLQQKSRRSEDWKIQKDWLFKTYPDSIRWNLPLNFDRLKPGIPQKISNTLDGVSLHQWSYLVDGECQGVISEQKTDAFAHNLWLAFPEEGEALFLPGALSNLMTKLPKTHPFSIDYPKGRFQNHFYELGFTHFRTLIWMSCRL